MALPLLLLGSFVAFVVGLGLAARFFGPAYINWLAAFVAEDAERGFAVGVCSGLPAAGVAVWWLLRHRRGTNLSLVRWLCAGALLMLSLFPLVVLLPPRHESTAASSQQRLVAEALPGAQNGAVTIFLVVAVCLAVGYALGDSRKRRWH